MNGLWEPRRATSWRAGAWQDWSKAQLGAEDGAPAVNSNNVLLRLIDCWSSHCRRNEHAHAQKHWSRRFRKPDHSHSIPLRISLFEGVVQQRICPARQRQWKTDNAALGLASLCPTEVLGNEHPFRCSDPIHKRGVTYSLHMSVEEREGSSFRRRNGVLGDQACHRNSMRSRYVTLLLTNLLHSSLMIGMPYCIDYAS
jgi:hypothetical protein